MWIQSNVLKDSNSQFISFAASLLSSINSYPWRLRVTCSASWPFGVSLISTWNWKFLTSWILGAFSGLARYTINLQFVSCFLSVLFIFGIIKSDLWFWHWFSFFFFFMSNQKIALERHQKDATHIQNGQKQKQHALKLSCIILTTKSKNTFIPPLSAWLHLCKILKKWSLKSCKYKALPSKSNYSFPSMYTTKLQLNHLPNTTKLTKKDVGFGIDSRSLDVDFLDMATPRFIIPSLLRSWLVYSLNSTINLQRFSYMKWRYYSWISPR